MHSLKLFNCSYSHWTKDYYSDEGWFIEIVSYINMRVLLKIVVKRIPWIIYLFLKKSTSCWESCEQHLFSFFFLKPKCTFKECTNHYLLSVTLHFSYYRSIYFNREALDRLHDIASKWRSSFNSDDCLLYIFHQSLVSCFLNMWESPSILQLLKLQTAR